MTCCLDFITKLLLLLFHCEPSEAVSTISEIPSAIKFGGGFSLRFHVFMVSADVGLFAIRHSSKMARRKKEIAKVKCLGAGHWI